MSGPPRAQPRVLAERDLGEDVPHPRERQFAIFENALGAERDPCDTGQRESR